MTQTTKPAPSAVRSWMQQRQVAGSPPPSLEQIRTELGWKLVAATRKSK